MSKLHTLAKHLRGRNGFSIFETIVVIAIFSVVVLAVVNLKSSTEVLQNVVNQKLVSRQDIDQMFQVLGSELRSAGTSNLGSYPIESASTSSLVFFSDTDRDGFMERIRYYYASSTVYKGVIKLVGSPFVYPTSSEVLTEAATTVNVSSTTPLFEYFDSSYTGAQTSSLAMPVDVTRIRVVKITVSRNEGPEVAPGQVTFSTIATIRRLRTF